jgi:predicted amidophosphoribosyltransferase
MKLLLKSGDFPMACSKNLEQSPIWACKVPLSSELDSSWSRIAQSHCWGKPPGRKYATTSISESNTKRLMKPLHHKMSQVHKSWALESCWCINCWQTSDPSFICSVHAEPQSHTDPASPAFVRFLPGYTTVQSPLRKAAPLGEIASRFKTLETLVCPKTHNAIQQPLEAQFPLQWSGSTT